MLSNVPAQTGSGELVEAVKLKDGDARDPQLRYHANLEHYFLCLQPFDETSISAGSASSTPLPVMSQRVPTPDLPQAGGNTPSRVF